MKKQQSTEKNYRTFNRNVQLLISEEFAEREIPVNDSVRLLEKIVEEMDLRSLFRAYKRRGRKAANNPATMLKILLYKSVRCLQFRLLALAQRSFAAPTPFGLML